jgi:hypothetical protein
MATIFTTPRELRDHIYSFTHHPLEFRVQNPQKDVDWASVTIEKVPEIGLLRSCRWLSAEYTEEMSSQFGQDVTICIRLYDHRSPSDSDEPVWSQDPSSLDLPTGSLAGVLTVFLESNSQWYCVDNLPFQRRSIKNINLRWCPLDLTAIPTVRVATCIAHDNLNLPEDPPGFYNVFGMPAMQTLRGCHRLTYADDKNSHEHTTHYIAFVYQFEDTKTHFWEREEVAEAFDAAVWVARCPRDRFVGIVNAEEIEWSEEVVEW